MSSNKVVLVTAGGSGMGAECARVLTSQGYTVAILSSSGRGEALAKELGGYGMTGSNLEPKAIERFVQSVVMRFGRIDAVVNSAGHGPKGPLLELSDDEWRTGMDIYLMNVIRIMRLVTPHFMTQGGGVAINISSFAAFEPEDAFPTSAVFRAGLASFTKLYAEKYGPHNIRMNNILPGFVDSLPESEERRSRIPMRRYGTVEEVAETVAFLLSEKGTYITGQNIKVDGGLTRSI